VAIEQENVVEKSAATKKPDEAVILGAISILELGTGALDNGANARRGDRSRRAIKGHRALLAARIDSCSSAAKTTIPRSNT